MDGRIAPPLNAIKRAMLATAATVAIGAPVAVGILHAPPARAQAQSAADWESAAGGKMAFEVASVKLDNGPFRPPHYPLDNGNAYTPSAQFSADFPLFVYIQFAYKMSFTQQQREAMLSRLPKWIQQDRYAIEARSTAIPTKDQVRLMVQSLLAERFGLKIHFETQETAVFAVTLLKDGKTGSGLRPHSEGPACDAPADQNQNTKDGLPKIFPERCETQGLMFRPGQLALAGGRNTTMDQLAGIISFNGSLGRPAVDQTGITGRIDYRIEFVRDPSPAAPPDATAEGVPGPTFLQAVRDQLGLKLEPARAPLRFLIVDSVNRPTEN
jgi:uncharacterized protein (TIGR03435 family)